MLQNNRTNKQNAISQNRYIQDQQCYRRRRRFVGLCALPSALQVSQNHFPVGIRVIPRHTIWNCIYPNTNQHLHPETNAKQEIRTHSYLHPSPSHANICVNATSEHKITNMKKKDRATHRALTGPLADAIRLVRITPVFGAILGRRRQLLHHRLWRRR
jgi:hypothetical protein